MLRALFDKQTLPDNFKMGLTRTWESYSYQFDSGTFASSFLSSYVGTIDLYCICVALKITKDWRYVATVHEIQEIVLYFYMCVGIVTVSSKVEKWKISHP